MRALAVAPIASFALGLGSASSPAPATAVPPGGPGSERELPIPADLAPRIQESIERGRMLYYFDKASAIGTDVVVANVPDLPAIPAC